MQLIMKAKFGSHLYGTSTPESDMDYKGIYIPDARELVLGTAKSHVTNNTSNSDQKNTSDDVDEELFSLKMFIEMALKGETIALDMIHTPPEMIVEQGKGFAIWEKIYENRHRFYTTDMKAYLGYVRKQASKYGVKGTRLAALRQVKEVADKLEDSRRKTPEELNRDLAASFAPGAKVAHINAVITFRVRDAIGACVLPLLEGFTSIVKDDKGNTFYEVLGRKYQDTMSIAEFKLKINKIWDEYGERARKAEANEGIDWKAMHHACRAGLQLKEIYETGDLKYPLQDAVFLKQIKNGEVSFSDVQEILEQIVEDVDRLSKEAFESGRLPEKADKEFWDNFVHDTYFWHIMETAKNV